MNNQWELVKAAAGESVCREQEPMAAHTTFRVGGPADLFVDPASAEDLARMLQVCRDEKIPYQVLGRGSNMLVGDRGYRGVIFHIADSMAKMESDGCRIEAQAGVSLTALARYARDLGLTGLEFAAGIPGSLGGALVMNAGAYGGEMKDVVREVQILDENGELHWLPVEELELSYRHSKIMDHEWVAMGARMELKPGKIEEIQALMNDLAERRRSKQPLEYPSAGSTFKRPVGYFAGKLIQDAGLAGYTVGGACVSEKHCGFVVNKDHATAADILQLCQDVAKKIREENGVELEMEVRCLGDF